MRGYPQQPHTPAMVRRGSYHLPSAPKPDTPPSRTPPLAIPAKGRSGGSPQQLATSLANACKDPSGDTSSSSLPNASAMDQYVLQRRPVESRVEKAAGDMKYSPGRKHAELSGSISRKGNGTIAANRPSILAADSSISLPKVAVDAQPQKRRVGAVPTTTTLSRASERQSTTPSRKSLDGAMASMNISSASSDSSGSASETTVISDGGFTDYLSDESEAELQRQAEVKAALIAQNHMEEQEFKAARQQLAHVDLRPPKSWTGN